MKYVAVLRPAYHLSPPAEDKVAFLESCRDYIAEKKQEGKIEAVYWLNVMPFGASDAIKGIIYLDVDSHAEAWRLLSNYPGYQVEGGVEFELVGNVQGDEFYSQALDSMKSKQGTEQ